MLKALWRISVMGLMAYELTVIDDQAVALSGSIPDKMSSSSPLVLLTILTIMVIAAIILGAAHSIKLHFYQTRLDELAFRLHCEPKDYNPRSVKSIKTQITILEDNLAENSLGGFVPVV